MRRVAWLLSSASLAVSVLGVRAATAAPTLRVQVSQNGDLTWIGNTSAQECAATATAPAVGTIGACGTNTVDTAPDIFWRADDTTANANTGITAANARSTAVLAIPVGATITYARLYWGGQLATNTPDTTVTVDRRVAAATVFTTDITADTTYSVPKVGANNVFWYEGTADVTDLIKLNGIGPYRVSGINSVALANFDSEDPFVAWSLVVFYDLATDPQRNLALFDGLDFVNSANPATVTITGFKVPTTGFDAKLGVMAFEGDIVFAGDSLIFGGNTLSDAVNPATNFFNGSRSWLGSPVSVAGDLPQMDGLPASMSGFDLDMVDISPYVTPGQTSATIQATSSSDTYVLGAFATSISTLQPEFGTAVKSFVDLNGGSLVRGDTIEYTIVAPNTGNDTALGVVLTDTLPVGVTYVPGTLQISAGPNAGAKTDAIGDDQGEYNALTRTVTVRLGTGADSTLGGSVPVAGSSTVKFQVKIDPGAMGSVENQAHISARGLKGNPLTDYPSGNGVPGTPTTFPIEECDNNVDCPLAKPICNTLPLPHVCVQCLVDSNCGAADSGRVCDIPATTCIDGCRGFGGNSCPTGQLCTSTTILIGTCFVPPSDAGNSDGALSDGAGGSANGDGSVGTGGSNGTGGTNGAGGAAGDDGSVGSDGSGTGGNDGSVVSDGSGTGGGDGSIGSGGSTGDASIGDSALADGSPTEGSTGDGGTGDGSPGDGSLLDGSLVDGSSVDGALGDGPAGDGALADGGALDGAGRDGGDGSLADSSSGDSGKLDGSKDGSVGPDGEAIDDGSIEGGGCACTTPGTRSSLPSSGTLMLLALAAGAVTRRRSFWPTRLRRIGQRRRRG
jgi:uncharacterized repeat protein (TIGR01451 family)/MYXO-CTERM domain-containing protein